MVARGGLKGLLVRRRTPRRRLPTEHRQTGGPAVGAEAGPGGGTVGDEDPSAAADSVIIGVAPKETQSIVFRCL